MLGINAREVFHRSREVGCQSFVMESKGMALRHGWRSDCCGGAWGRGGGERPSSLKAAGPGPCPGRDATAKRCGRVMLFAGTMCEAIQWVY
jgi:hypothetical protein